MNTRPWNSWWPGRGCPALRDTIYGGETDGYTGHSHGRRGECSGAGRGMARRRGVVQVQRSGPGDGRPAPTASTGVTTIHTKATEPSGFLTFAGQRK
ncbi:hypothetical protein E2C01_031292 [Portunus trituberculatus]|uniref:Uncharacterized protein n=1 Tax=Portunus trituberculatus TaxID=210409 RepID=A0A5B7ET27_PORTR|nr:hypothetical protein [Portunus trituberculatus]